MARNTPGSNIQPTGASGGVGGGGSSSGVYSGVYCGGGVYGSGGYSSVTTAEENSAFEPPDVFCALGSLIVEGRLPAQGTGKGVARGQPRPEGRGYSEGPHVELPGRISRHKCSSEEYLCAKNENFRRHMLLLWQNNVAMSVEVLLCSDCRIGRAKAGSLEVTAVPEPGSILLEQWTVSVLDGPREVGMDSLSLLQAVRSYLHFSQLSAWYSKTGGFSPKNILIRITIPGEEFASKFSRAPEEHYFPMASVGHKSAVAVYVRSLPRTDDIPLVVCAHTLQAEEDEESKLALAGSLSWRDPTDLRRVLVKAKLAASESLLPGAADCAGRLIKSDSMDSMLGDSLLDPPQSFSKMAPRRYQSPSRCGSPSLEAPDHLLSGRRDLQSRSVGNPPPPPSYEQSLAFKFGEDTPDFRLNRHDLMRRRDMHLFVGLHPRMLHSPPRFSLPPKTTQPVKPSSAIPCRAMTCQKPLLSDRMPNFCTRSGKHICEFEELEDGLSKPPDPGPESSGSPTGDNYKQTELGAKRKGWSGRIVRSSTPYSRDSSSDSSSYQPDSRLKHQQHKTVPCMHQNDLETELSPKEIEDVISLLRSRASPTCSKEQRRPSLRDECLEDILFPVKSRRPSLDEWLEPQVEFKIPLQVTQVWRAELSVSPPQLREKILKAQVEAGQASQLNTSQDSALCLDSSSSSEAEFLDKGDILLGAILRHSNRLIGVPPAIHSARDTNIVSSHSTSSDISPLTPDHLFSVPHCSYPLSSGLPVDLVDLCAELETKCLISKQQEQDKENDPSCGNSPHRSRSYSEVISPFKFSLVERVRTLEPLDMSFDDYDDHTSFSANSAYSEPKSKSEKRRNSIDDDSIPSANKKAAFRKSFDSATSMVFHSRNGLPLTSSPAPMRRGIKFDFDSGISTPKDIKRALFESQSPEDSVCGSSKKKKRDPRRLLSTSAPASVTGNNLLGNFEESVLNGRLEPVSTVEGFTAEIGASGTFHPKHLYFPVTVFFYTLCENSNIASPYLGHINLGKKGYRVPEKGTIQITLFNPLGTVVKMFVVMYDLSDMPPNSQTFLRQRTLYMPADQCDSHEDSRKWLRYLIHLRLTSSRSGKIYLHTDVRMIIFRKSDLDTASDHQQGKGFELRSFTRGPSNPKFSPRK